MNTSRPNRKAREKMREHYVSNALDTLEKEIGKAYSSETDWHVEFDEGQQASSYGRGEPPIDPPIEPSVGASAKEPFVIKGFKLTQDDVNDWLECAKDESCGEVTFSEYSRAWGRMCEESFKIVPMTALVSEDGTITVTVEDIEA